MYMYACSYGRINTMLSGRLYSALRKVRLTTQQPPVVLISNATLVFCLSDIWVDIMQYTVTRRDLCVSKIR